MILFSAPWCVKCKPIKDKLEGSDVDIVDISTADGAQKAAELGIRGVPTVVDNDVLIVGQEKIMAHLKD